MSSTSFCSEFRVASFSSFACFRPSFVRGASSCRPRFCELGTLPGVLSDAQWTSLRQHCALQEHIKISVADLVTHGAVDVPASQCRVK